MFSLPRDFLLNAAAKISEIDEEHHINDETLSWSGKDLMKGLGNNSRHHVSSSISVNSAKIKLLCHTHERGIISSLTADTYDAVISYLEQHEKAHLRISSSKIDAELMGTPLNLARFGETNLDQLRKFRTSPVSMPASQLAGSSTRLLNWDPELHPKEFNKLSWKVVGINFIVSSEAELFKIFNVLASAKHLRTLTMQSTVESYLCSTEPIDGKVHVHLESIAGLNQLELISMNSIPVHGDIDALSHLEHLEDLSLRNSLVFGNLASLSGLINLLEISLRNTSINGDLQNISDLEKLKFLDLGYTNIHGNLQSLSKMLQLENLLLSGTKVHGSILSLVGLSKLRTLYLCDTHVQNTKQDEAVFFKSISEDSCDLILPFELDDLDFVQDFTDHMNSSNL